MLSGTFITELKSKKQIEIPFEIVNRLRLDEGDKVEVLIKRIRSRRLDIRISKNPMVKLLEMTKELSEQ